MDSIFSMNPSLRISGLATGIDTDSIVGDLLRAKRIPMDRLKQNKQVLQWQQEGYREINTALRSFRDTVFDMKLQGTYMAKTATSSNEAAMGASAGTSAVPGIYSVNVTQLAEGVSKGSQGALADEVGDNGSTKTLAEQFGLSDTIDTISFTLEGSGGSKEFAFDTATANIYHVAAEINNAKLGISASYDAAMNRFFLTTSATGESAKILVTADSHNFLTGSPESADGSDSILQLKLKAGVTYIGQDAEFSFGDAENLKSATNTVTVNGINLNLKQSGMSGTVTVANNTDAVFNSIKEFVTSYNELIDKINSRLSETRYRDYLPLTDEQRESLSEEQVKKWEEKAKSGLLRNDILLQSVVTKMRAAMFSSVPGPAGEGYRILAQLGITTGSYTEKGKLHINEAKLREAIQKDPDGVMDLFTKSSDIYDEKGIAQKLYDEVNNSMSLISAKAGSESTFDLTDESVIGKRLKTIDDNIEKMKDRLIEVENRYWRQFTAMEKAINRMNVQSAWLAQQFGQR